MPGCNRAPVRRRWVWPLALGGAFLLISVPPIIKYAFAHEGHGTEEVGEYDIDAPRILSPETAKHIDLKTAEVDFRPIEEVLEISGIVKPHPDRHRMVVARVSGKVVSVAKIVGDSVKKGELLAQIDSPEFARNLYEVRKLDVEYQQLLLDIDRSLAAEKRLAAEWDVARALLDYAKKESARAESLIGEGIARKDLAERTAALAQAKGDLLLNEIEKVQAGKETVNLQDQDKALQLSRTALLVINNIDPATIEPGTDGEGQLTGMLEIRAAAEGVVVKRSAMPGQWIEAGGTILETADYRSVQIEGELPESLIARVRARTSNKVRVRIPSDSSFLEEEGELRFMAPDLDPVKRTAHLIVDMPNPDGVLRGEMWVNLSVVLREVKSAMVVPRSAVVVDGPMHFVFIIDPDSSYKNAAERLAAEGFKKFKKEDVGKIVRQLDDGSFWILDEYSPAEWKPHGGRYQKKDILPGYTDDRYVEVKYVDGGLVPDDVVVTQGTYSLTQLRPRGVKREDAAGTGNDGPDKEGYNQ